MKSLILTFAFIFSIIFIQIVDINPQATGSGAGGGVEPQLTGSGAGGGVEP